MCNQIDRYVLGAFTAPTVIGQYNAAKRIQEAGYSIALKVAEVLFPFFTATTQLKTERQTMLYLFSSWVVMSCGAIVLGPMIPLAEPFMRMWIGSTGAEGAGILLRTLIVGSLVGCGSNVFSFFLMGIGRNMPSVLVSLTYSALTIIFSIIALSFWGPYAAGVGLAAAGAVRIALSLYVIKTGILKSMLIASWCASTLLPLCISIALGYAWLNAVSPASVQGWGALLRTYAMLSTSIGLAICVAAGLTKFGRGALVDLFRIIRGLLVKSAA